MKHACLLAVSTLALALCAPAQTHWTGLGSSLNWSDSNNWDSLPSTNQPAYFEDLLYSGYTNVAGAVNNIVDTNNAAGSAVYTALSQASGTHFYTTLIPSGVTLTLGGLGNNALVAGDVPGTSSFLASGSATNYSTIKGPGSLVVNDSASLMSVNMRNRATLDLSGLSSLTAGVKQLWVAVSPDNPNNTAGLAGSLFLAETNNITTAPNPNVPGILLGAATNTSATATVLLGYSNTFNTDALVVGGRRAAFGTVLQFGLAASNTTPLSTFTLRGSAGNDAASVFSIGDLSAEPGGFNAIPFNSAASSTANFAGGNVDIWVDSLYIGRSTPANGLAGNLSGTGTLIVENGTVTATNVYMSYKVTSTNNTAGQGTLFLRSNATMNVVKDFYLCFRTNGSFFLGQPLLSVSNNAVLNIGGNLLCTNVGGWTPAAIKLGDSGAINMTGGGYVVTPTLTGIGSITGSGNVVVTNALSMNTDTSVGTLNVASNLTLANPFRVTFNLGADTTVGGGVNDYLNVANNVTFNNNPLNITFGAPLIVGTYTLIGYGGTQSGNVTWVNPTRSPIGLVQGSGQVAIVVTNLTPGTLTWKGTNGVTGSWDSSTTNWNNNTDKFFALDSVVFDDTGAATNVTIASITNVPANVTFNNSVNKYTVTQSGSGAIGGFTALNKNGTGTLAMGGGGANNYFTGPVNLNQGILQIASFNQGVLGYLDSVSAINIASGAMLDLNGNSIGSGGSYARAVNLVGSGVGGIGAIVHNGISSSPSLTTRNVALTGDATIGCTTAGLRVTLAGMTQPYLYTFDLAGHTLTTTGAGAVALGAYTMTSSGSITVNSASLVLGPNSSASGIILDGPGTINLGSKTLSFGSSSGAFTTGYVAKAISVTSGAIIAPTANATPIQLRSPITIADGGLLNITNSQTILASGIISGNSSVTKYGNSNLVMSAANTFTGPLEVAAGQLSLTTGGSLASSQVLVDAPAFFDVTGLAGGYTVPSGQNVAANGNVVGNITIGAGGTLSGFGTNEGTVTVSPGGTLAVGSPTLGGTLTLTSDLTCNGGTNDFKLGGPDDLIVVGGNLTFTAPTVIRIDPVGALNGSHVLYQYTGTMSGVNTSNLKFSTPRPLTFVLDTSVPGIVSVTISGSVTLDWNGGVPAAPTAWDINTTANWLNGGNPDIFFNGDLVQFGDLANTNLVSLATTMQPGTIAMNNSSVPYTFIGAGGLGAGSFAMNGGGSLTLSNAGNVTLTGSGLALNAGTLTFNQVSNTTLTGKISGSGALAKGGSNTLTVVSADSTNFTGTVAVNAGTLRSASVNALGSSTITVDSGGTWDINGQLSMLSAVSVAGVGADGQGAINNRGAQQTNAIDSLTFTADTVLGAASNRWDVAPVDTNGTPGSFTGNGYKLTKTGGADLWVRQLTDTGLGNIDVTAGRLIFAGATTKMGLTSANLTVRSNATLGFGYSLQDGGKNTVIAQGGQLYAVGSSNEYGGPMVLSGGLVKLEPNAQLGLGGNLSGPANLTVQGTSPGLFGTLTLSGTNTYTGGTLVNDGELDFASSNSIPIGTNIVLASRVAYNSSGHPVIGLLTNVVSPASVQLVMQTFGSNGAAQAYLQGNGGTWSGPIKMLGSDAHCVANFNSGLLGLTVAGAVDGTAFFGNNTGNGGVKVGGDTMLVTNVSLDGVGIRFNNPLQFTGTFSCNNSGLGGQPGMTKLVLASGGNSWTNMFWQRGVIQFGADNALPLCPITIGTLAAGADHRTIVDLNGHTGTLANWIETFLGNDVVWFGNSSTNANGTLTYAGTGTNTWTAYILDAFDTNAAVQKTTSLSVTAGYLKLIPFPGGDPNPNNGGLFPSGPPPYPIGMTYSGPTTISGGTLEVNKYLGVSAVTVSGTGKLKGLGPIGGAVNVNSGGTIAPGTNTIGALAVSNNVTFNAGGKGLFRVNLITGVNDQLVGLSTLTYGGTLVITNLGAQPFTNGTILNLFSATTYVAGPVSIQPAVPAPGLVWDASQLAVDGTLRVKTPVPTTISGVGRLGDGNVGFTINGGFGQAYSVRASSNVAAPVATWTVIESGTLPSASYNFSDLNATNFPSRFYIISTP